MVGDNGTLSGAELREQRRARNMDSVRRAAMTLFAEHGYAEVTVEDIAGAAGISERTFFRYFASKDHLLVAEANRRVEVIHASLAAQPPDLDAWAALRVAVLEQASGEERVGRHAAIWAQITKEAPALLAKTIMHGALEGTQRIEVELARRLGVPPTDPLPDVMMRVALAALQSAYLRWLDHDDESLTDLAADAFDIVGAGLAGAVPTISSR